ncbi:MAG TPA: hypothetical protein VFE82_14255 [Ramlibacter sp.]|jgi:hypothetical protein|uniref:hypothetical protein n=1 Tax=Ramlibacter sp. TaxID=1917967 RepID=UPI002D37986E|nr:hypothetical protein [Ramlibacter sp.]HZY19635.1 hypothetical protein [Ramlibacter sp.]
MARDDKPPRDPEGKRPEGGAPRGGAARSAAWPRPGRSGYGMESIRPHLRAQLEQQKLLRPTFPPEPEDPGEKS